jgi:hypothetical protein
MLKTLSLTFGAVFLLIGLLGLVPAATPDDKLLGLFMVDGTHNVIHILSGILGLAAGSTSEKHSRLYLVGFGAVYALVTVIGFAQGDTVLGLFHVNAADNFLHLVLAAGLLGSGLGVKPGNAGVNESD